MQLTIDELKEFGKKYFKTDRIIVTPFLKIATSDDGIEDPYTLTRGVVYARHLDFTMRYEDETGYSKFSFAIRSKPVQDQTMVSLEITETLNHQVGQIGLKTFHYEERFLDYLALGGHVDYLIFGHEILPY